VGRWHSFLFTSAAAALTPIVSSNTIAVIGGEVVHAAQRTVCAICVCLFFQAGRNAMPSTRDGRSRSRPE